MTKISVDYVDHMGDDLRTVNAARVSFGKETTELTERDEKLIGYLGRHKHWTTSAHNQLTLRIHLPIWLARHFTKHQIGAVVNEVSRRYVDTTPEVWWPSEWRSRPENGIKQGSGASIKDLAIDTAYSHATNTALAAYADMLALGVAPEQARSVLPQGTFTTLFVTGSLVYWARMYNQRCGSEGHPQAEWTAITDRLHEIAGQYWPHTWRSLTDG